MRGAQKPVNVNLRPAAAGEWHESLQSGSADYALAHTFAFGEAIAKVYPEYAFTPQIAEFSDGVRALWPLVKQDSKLKFLRQYEAMPPSLNGMPIATQGALSSEHCAALLKTLGADRMQLNGGVLDSAPLRLPAGDWEIKDLETHVLDVREGWDAVWQSKFNDKVRNQCRTAWKKGVEVKVAGSTADFETYYEIYADSTRRWGYAKPPYPPELFAAFASLNGRGVELKLGIVNGQAIAGIMLLHGRRSTLYWSGAMLKEFASYSANNGLLEVAIREACERGAANFDFGASGELESVRKFKEQFGAAPVPYQSLSLQSGRYKLAMGARQKLAGLKR